MTGLSFMGFVALLLLGLGVLASLIGGVLLLVAAFRQHVGWGLATLFVPFAGLVFVAMHWTEARRGFLLQVMGLVILAVGMFAALDGTSSPRARIAALASGRESPAATDNTESLLKLKEAEVSRVEQEVAALQAKLNSDYESLKTRRAALGTDPAAVEAFNRDAAAYAVAKTDLSVKSGMLVQLKLEQAQLTDQVFLQARESAKTKPKPAGVPPPTRAAATPRPITVTQGDVLMYTTTRCPACIAAKQYLARRGVPYREINVENDRDGMAEFQKRGGRAVPLIVVKGRQMVGFDERELDKLL